MKKKSGALIAAAVLVTFTVSASSETKHERGTVVVPKSSIERAGDVGLRAHTNVRIFVPESGMPQAGGPPFPGYFYETPASIACLYNLVSTKVPGCNPTLATANPRGGAGAIAIVDAFDAPNAASDLAAFDQQFDIAPADFTVVYAAGTPPPVDPSGGWELEESLDIEWAHAMAPKAKLYLVEAASNSFLDLFTAEQVASNLVVAAGGGDVSNSWGGGEFDGESYFDSIFFATPGVVYFASAGDGAGTLYPSVSPNVVSAGGTTISRNATTGSFIFEAAWEDGGGGIAQYERRPWYQNGIASLVGTHRGSPDFSFDSNPNTGVWVLDTNLYQGFPGGWFIVGGTSVASPSLAGIVNAAGHFAKSSAAELGNIYGNLGNGSDFNDTVVGFCSFYDGTFTAPGWDFCTGVGSNKGYSGK